MTIIASLEAVATLAIASLLIRHHAQQAAAWTTERRELLNRIQRPEHVPVQAAGEYKTPEILPDDIDTIGRVIDHPEPVDA